MPTVSIEIGYPTRFVREIGDNDPNDLNDVPIRFLWESNVSGFQTANITLSAGTIQGELVQRRGDFYVMMVRPPDSGTGTITVTVTANAVAGGNTEVSASFNYTDVVQKTALFNWGTAIPGLNITRISNQNFGPRAGLVVEGDRIRLFVSRSGGTGIHSLTRAGVRKASEDIGVSNAAGVYSHNVNGPRHSTRLTKVNGTYYASYFMYNDPQWQSYIIDESGAVTAFSPANFGIPAELYTDLFTLKDTFRRPIRSFKSVDINRWGLFILPWRVTNDGLLAVRQWDGTFVSQETGIMSPYTQSNAHLSLLASEDRLYVDTGANFEVYQVDESLTRLIDEELPSFMGPQQGQLQNLAPDMAVYGQKLYTTGASGDPQLYEIKLEKYRAPAVRARILPQFIVEGGSLPLKHFVDGAAALLFEQTEDYTPPSYLSIDQNLNLVVADGEITADTCVLVKLRAFSLRAETALSFYLVIEKKQTPVWKDVETLPMDNGETVNLLGLVPNAKRVEWKSGFQVPPDFSVSNSKLTVANQTSEAPVAVELTAFNDEGSSDKTFNVVTHIPNAITSSETFNPLRVLIAGIDVSNDVTEVSGIRKSLDVINPNVFVSNSAHIRLSSDRGKYDGRVDGNFWDANGLPASGYLSEIEVWVDILDTGTVQSKLLFEGLIRKPVSNIGDVSAVLECIERTYLLKNTDVAEVGIEKFSALSKVQETYQGEYKPDASILPIQREGASVVSGLAAVPVVTYPNSLEGVVSDAQVCVVESDKVLSSGGYLSDDPLLKFKTPYQRRLLSFLIKEISEASGYFNPKVDINAATPAAAKGIASRGNVAFNVEKTKRVRGVVDWVHDPTNDVFYALLSHPSAYIRDTLVRYTPETDRYEVLKTFDFGIRVTQLTSADFEDFYIIVTTANDLDFSESASPPNHNEAVFDPLDSSRETKDTQILKYVKSTDTLTTFVDVGDDHPVQVGLHYMAGFENERYIRLREGIFAEARSTFKIQSNYLYYRFAKWDTFGVARVATSGGATAAMLIADRDEYFNTLNFDFDVAPNGDIYMPYSEGTRMDSGLFVKKYDAGADASDDMIVLASTLSNLKEIDSVGGAYLGCHEVLFANDALYFIVPIQRATLDESFAIFRDIQKSAGAVLYRLDLHTAELTVLERYDYVQQSCRSLTLHENQVYFAEYPNASTQYAPSNEDLDGWDAERRENTVDPNKTWLKRAVSGTETEAVATPWYEGQTFPATSAPLLSDGEALHAIVRVGDSDEISVLDAEASKRENEQWVTLTRAIDFYLEDVPSGSLHDVLVNLAQLSNTRLQILANRFRFDDVDPYEALLSTGLSDSASQLNFKDANKEFPASGHVLIGEEIIAYTTRTAAQLSGLTRGVQGSLPAAHSSGDRVLFLDKVIPTSAIKDPYKNINVDIDTNKFYNIVTDSQNTGRTMDAESVARFGEKKYTTNLALSDHQISWRRYLNAKTLNRLKDIKSLVQMTLPAAYYLDLANVTTFAYAGEILLPIRIIDIQYTQRGNNPPIYETHLIGEEIKPLPRVSFGNATVADKTWTQYAAVTPFTLPRAENHKASYVYRLEELPTGGTFDPDTLEVAGLPIGVQSATPVRYSVTDSENPVWQDALEFNITVNGAALAFAGSQPEIVVEVGDAVSEMLVGARGGSGRLASVLTGNLTSGLSFNTIGRRIHEIPTEVHGNRLLTHRVTDENGTSVTDTFNIRSLLANRLMVSSGGSLQSYAFNGDRNTSEDVSPSGFTGFIDSGDGFWGGTVRGDRILLVERNVSQRRSRLFIYDRGFNRISSEEQTFANQYFRDIAWIPGGHWLFCKSARLIDFYTEDWVEDPSRQINVSYRGAYDIRAITATATRIYVLYERGQIRALTHDGEFIDGVSGNAGGGASSIAVTPEGIVADGSRMRLYDFDLGVIRTIDGVSTATSFIALNPRRFLED